MIGDSDDNSGGSDGGDDVYNGSTKPMLVLFSDS